MDCELPGEKKADEEKESTWRDRAEKMVGRLRNSIISESAKKIEDQLNWIKARPSVTAIRGLIEESPRMEELSSDEKLLVKYLKEVSGRVADITSKIQETASTNNLKKAKLLWSTALESGVNTEEVASLGYKVIELEKTLAERKAQKWAPRPYSIQLDTLRELHAEWEEGNMPADDYLFGLLENNQEFFTEFLKEVAKTRKMTTHLCDDTLLGWISKLDSLMLELDSKIHISNFLKIRSGLRAILKIVQKSELSVKDHTLLLKVKDEISAWNRKLLTEDQYTRFMVELGNIQCLEGSIDTKDYDWTQFQQKIAEYAWRQEVRIKLAHPLTEEQVQVLLRRAPRELKATKVNEWNCISEKAKEVEWMDDKRVTDRIRAYLDSMVVDDNMPTIMKFINDAYISIISDATLDKLKVFERAVTFYSTKAIESVEQLEELVKEMLDRKFYQNKTFEYFDKILNTIRNLKTHVSEIEKTKEILTVQKEQDLTITVEQISRMEKVGFTEILNLMNSLDQVPESLSANLISNQDDLLAEINAFREFREEAIVQTERFASILSSVVNGEALAAVQKDFKMLLHKYYFTYSFRDDSLESHLRKVGVLIKACDLLESGWPVAEVESEPMLNELDQDKAFEGVSVNLYKEIAFWESILKEVKALYLGQEVPPLVVDELESPLKDAKKLIQLIHKVNMSNMPQEKRNLTVEGLRLVIAEKREASDKIKMEDSIAYLQTIVNRCEDIDQVLAKDRNDLEELKQAMAFMKSVSVQLGDQMKKCQSRINRANQFLDKFNNLTKDKLENDFELNTEEYNSLNIEIPAVEEVFNTLQECRNLKGEAERLLASDESTLEDMLDLKKRLAGMKFFKSTSMVANILTRLFYKMREAYERSEDDSETTIDYSDLCKFIGEAQNILTQKGKNEIRAELKEKTGMVNQIFKDVTEHLKKHIYSLDLKAFKEKKPDDIFRGFVDIKAPIEEHRLKLESKEATSKVSFNTSSSAVDKPKADIEKFGEGGGISQDLRTYYVTQWRECIGSNKAFNFDAKETSQNAKRIERQIFEKYGKDVTEYERFCEEIGRLLKDFIFYTDISENIRTKKFCMSNLGVYLGKSAADIRQINYALSIEPTAQPADLFKGDPKSSGMGTFQPSQAKEGSVSKTQNNEQFENKVVYEEIKGKSQASGETRFYKVYQGDMSIQLKDNYRLDQINLVTAHKSSAIAGFSQIPNHIVIPTQQPLQSFVSWINKVLHSSEGKYKLMHGYCSSPVAGDKVSKLHQMMLEKHLVASRPYTEKFRVYIFPKEFLQKEWLESIEFVSLGKEADLIFFIVFKCGEAFSLNIENPMSAEPVVAPGAKLYRLQLFGKVKDEAPKLPSTREPKVAPIATTVPIRITPSAHIAPISDPLAQVLPRKSPLDQPSQHDDSFSRSHKGFNKTGSNYGLYQGVPSGAGGPQMGMSHSTHFGEEHEKPSRRDQHYRNETEYGFSKKYTPPRADWAQTEEKFGLGESRIGPSYENDLLGALQNVKPRAFIKNSGHSGHSHPHSQSFSQKMFSGTVSSGNLATDTSNYGQPLPNNYLSSKNSKMLSKRPPVVSNANSLLSGSFSIKAQQGTASMLGANETSPQGGSKSFLQTAINSIQVPPSQAGGGHSHGISDTRPVHQNIGKKNSGLNLHSKSSHHQSDLRASLQSITEHSQNPASEAYSKKKSGKGQGGGSGVGGTKFQSSMPFDYVKNQHF